MTRATKQDTVVKYALLRGKLVPRDEVLKTIKAEVEPNIAVDDVAPDVEVEPNADIEPKPKATRRKSTVKSKDKSDDFAIDEDNSNADTKAS